MSTSMDPAKPHATAVAIAGDTIVAVGSDAEVKQLAGAGTKLIDAGGASVTPGLIDAHCHLYGLGVDLDSISVGARCRRRPRPRDRRGSEEPRASPASGSSGAAGIRNRWAGQAFPTRASLDAQVVIDRWRCAGSMATPCG